MGNLDWSQLCIRKRDVGDWESGAVQIPGRVINTLDALDAFTDEWMRGITEFGALRC
ncbi:hypothetical protein ACWGK5_16780 [Rhodococcus qingshengii]